MNVLQILYTRHRTVLYQLGYKLGYWLVTGAACLAIGLGFAVVIVGWLEEVNP